MASGFDALTDRNVQSPARQTSERQAPARQRSRSQRDPSPLSSILLILSVGIATYLLALPWSETVNGDAVSRTYLAWAWSEAPHWISADIWLPLTTYVTGMSLWVLPFPFWTPVLLNVVLTSVTAICLWAFTRQELRGGLEPDQGRDIAILTPLNRQVEDASRFVAIAFLLTPVAFRHSLMALSEPLYVLLLSLLMVFLSKARRQGRLSQALAAGCCLTLAAATRYEAWPLIPVMALLLWRRPKLMVVLGLVASAFPLYWLISSHINYGDALHMIKFQSVDTAEVLASSGGMTLTRRLVRLVFFPMTLLFGMTVGVLGLSLLGVWRSRVTQMTPDSPHRLSLIWLAPFITALLLLVYKATTGTLNLELRYSLALALFLLPYAAVGVQTVDYRWRRLVLLSIFPLGYVLYLAQPMAQPLLQGIRRSPAEYSAPIPRINAMTRRLIHLVSRHRGESHPLSTRHSTPLSIPLSVAQTARELATPALMVWGFESSQVAQQVVFHSGLSAQDQLCLSETFSDRKWSILLGVFVTRHPSGLMLVESAKHPTLPVPGSGPQQMTFDDVVLELTAIDTEGPAVLYRYRRVDPTH